MRIVVVWLAVLGFVETAVAADLGPYLRGPQYEEPVPAYRWSGVYGGGQVGYSGANIDFGRGVNALLASMLRILTIEQTHHISDWPVLPNRNPVGISFGAFVGYNWQWEDAVVGLEINYNRSSLTGSSSNSIERTFVADQNGANYVFDFIAQGDATIRITDFGTFRVRGGWAADRFLPYGFVGLAVGRVDISRSASLTGTGTPPQPPGNLPTLTTAGCVSGSTDVAWISTQPPQTPPAPSPCTLSDARKGLFAYGAAAGLGVDVILLPNVFLRGEWEFVQFAPLEGSHFHINTIRTGLGVKF